VDGDSRKESDFVILVKDGKIYKNTVKQ